MNTKVFSALAVLVGLAVTAAAADDSYLYWMTDSTATLDGAAIPAGSYARIAYGSGTYDAGVDGYLSLFYLNPDDTMEALTDGRVSVSGAQYGLYAKFESNAASYTYFVELLNESGNVLGYHNAGAYGDLGEFIATSNIDFPANPFFAGTFTAVAVPEPTSGLLMLIGIAGLALRRKNKKA